MKTPRVGLRADAVGEVHRSIVAGVPIDDVELAAKRWKDEG